MCALRLVVRFDLLGSPRNCACCWWERPVHDTSNPRNGSDNPAERQAISILLLSQTRFEHWLPVQNQQVKSPKAIHAGHSNPIAMIAKNIFISHHPRSQQAQRQSLCIYRKLHRHTFLRLTRCTMSRCRLRYLPSRTQCKSNVTFRSFVACS